jgi:hypothetical protein
MTWAKGSRANRCWIYLLTFCLDFFVAGSVAMLVFCIDTKVGWRMGIRMALLCLFLNTSTFRALQKRRVSHASAKKNLADMFLPSSKL